jgi:hypothetical protein
MSEEANKWRVTEYPDGEVYFLSLGHIEMWVRRSYDGKKWVGQVLSNEDAADFSEHVDTPDEAKAKALELAKQVLEGMLAELEGFMKGSKID